VKKKKPAGSRRKSGRPLVTLRVGPGGDGEAGVVPRTPRMARLASEWMYILRNRYRWSDDDDLRETIRRRAKKDLAALGVDDGALTRMVRAGSQQIEVGFHDDRDDGAGGDGLDDAASAFPWEFVLSSATREAGRAHSVVITRWLEAGTAQRPPQLTGKNVPSEVLFVASAPGRLDGRYSFDSEIARLTAAIGHRWKVSRSESADELTRRIARERPKLIHVSGVDNHQAARLIDEFYADDHLRMLFKDQPVKEPLASVDGMVLRGALVPEEPVRFGRLADCLVPAGQPPWLVTLNLHYSAARTARECVRRGAQAALGFLDEIDDELAEYFFQAFYWAWRHEKNVDLSRAFGNAWRLMRELDKLLFGTGIVLWRAQSAFADGVKPILPETAEPEYLAASRLKLPTAEERARTRALPMTQVLQVTVDVPPTLNYSLLHNGRPFLDGLTLSKLVDHPLDEVKVQVDLNVGDLTHPFRHTELLLTEPQRVMTDKVRVPLTSQLLRSLNERLQTTVYVRVEWDGRTACEETQPVTLLPVDEWFDDTEQNPWLPSFVLPRDPAVAGIIGRARPHLVTLQDDPGASFDGYQSGDDDPESTDRQVQALWTTLVQDYRLLYINPPPAYSDRTQRLRTPSEIVATGSGTCVDLALLLASCLEYMDIYPVVVLLAGHAFVGYWRTEPFHQRFCAIEHVPELGIEIGPESVQSKVALVDPFKWRLSQQQYLEIMGCVRRDELRMLEATGLCFNFSFAESLREGRGNMTPRSEFDSLLDIKLARSAQPPVTPLPIERRT
jgi:hypothetical protein